MTILFPTRYPGKAEPVSSDYPMGAPRDRSTPATDDGTPLRSLPIADLYGFVGALLKAAGIEPDNTLDTANSSQAFAALEAYIAGVFDAATTSWSISPADFELMGEEDVDALTTSGSLSGPVDLQFSADGMKLFLLDGIGNKRIIQFSTLRPFDANGMTYDNVEYDLTTEGGTLFSSFEFNPEGTKIWVSVQVPDVEVVEYNLGTAWDLSTISYSGTTHDFSGDIASGAIYDMALVDNGTRMLIRMSTNDMFRFTLSTAWDLSTASLVETHSLDDLVTSTFPGGLDSVQVHPNGLSVFFTGNLQSSPDYEPGVAEFTLGAAWDISTVNTTAKQQISLIPSSEDIQAAAGMQFSPKGTRAYFAVRTTNTGPEVPGRVIQAATGQIRPAP